MTFVLYRGLMTTLVFKAVCHNNLTTGLVAVSYPDWSYRNEGPFCIMMTWLGESGLGKLFSVA